MCYAKLKWVAVVCLSVSLAGAGGTIITYRASGAQQTASRPQATVFAAQEKPRQPQPDEQKAEKNKLKERTYGFLGVKFSGDKETGPAVVHEVFADSPAAKAGVKVDDIVLKIGKTDVKNPFDAVNAIKKLKPGEKVILRIKRGEKEKDVSITLGKWPADFKEDGKDEKPGSPKAEKARGYFGLKLRDETEDGPVVIDGIEPDSPAAKAGIKAEDVLLKAGKDEVKTAEKLIKLLSKLKEGDKVTFRIKRGEKEMDVTITAAKRPADFGKE
jgi:S1-C subfamily serine protease